MIVALAWCAAESELLVDVAEFTLMAAAYARAHAHAHAYCTTSTILHWWLQHTLNADARSSPFIPDCGVVWLILLPTNKPLGATSVTLTHESDSTCIYIFFVSATYPNICRLTDLLFVPAYFVL